MLKTSWWMVACGLALTTAGAAVCAFTTTNASIKMSKTGKDFH
jgi:hypothetical protein